MLSEPGTVYKDDRMWIVGYTEGMFLFTPEGVQRPGVYASSMAAKLAAGMTDEQIEEHLGPIYNEGKHVFIPDVRKVLERLEQEEAIDHLELTLKEKA